MKPTKTWQFAMAISERLAEKDWDMADLARRIGTSYEYSRKLSKGLVVPSRDLLKKICEVLELDREKMWTLVIADKIKKQYGNLPSALTGKDPRFMELEPLLSKLTQEQYETMLAMVEVLADRNRMTEPSAASTEVPHRVGTRQSVFKMHKHARAELEARKEVKS
jgi:transcriptional regulator with XRE-family HTH domain